MEIIKAMIGSAEDGRLFICELLEDSGKLWLVPFWFVNRLDKYRMPKRIIRVNVLDHQRFPLNDFGVEALITSPIPTSVLKDHARSVAGVDYEVEEAPSIRLPLPE